MRLDSSPYTKTSPEIAFGTTHTHTHTCCLLIGHPSPHRSPSPRRSNYNWQHHVNGFVLPGAQKQQLVLRAKFLLYTRLRCTLINSMHFAVCNFTCTLWLRSCTSNFSSGVYLCDHSAGQREHLPGNFITQNGMLVQLYIMQKHQNGEECCMGCANRFEKFYCCCRRDFLSAGRWDAWHTKYDIFLSSCQLL